MNFGKHKNCFYSEIYEDLVQVHRTVYGYKRAGKREAAFVGSRAELPDGAAVALVCVGDVTGSLLRGWELLGLPFSCAVVWLVWAH